MAIYDYCYLANAFLQLIPEKETGDVAKIRHLYARTMRVGTAKSPYKQVIETKIRKRFKRWNIIHSKDGGTESGIYGTPSYLGSRLSSVLYQSYELLMRRFLKNGAHLGYAFIFNLRYSDFDDEKGTSPTEEKIKDSIKGAKGLGNGSNWYLNLGGVVDEQGKPVKIDDILKIENMAQLLSKVHMDKDSSENLRNNILSAHRIPPVIMSVVIDGKTVGDIDKIVKLYSLNIVTPIQQTFREDINKKLPSDRWIDFDPYHIF